MRCWRRRRVLAQVNFSVQENKEARIRFSGNTIPSVAPKARALRIH
jgi:hypothetical protein